MKQIVEGTEQVNGVNVHFVETKKFKTIHIVAKFKAPLQKETITKRALLPYMLRQGTKTYESEMKLQQKLDQLYGSSLSIDGAKKGNHHIISIRLEVANEKYIQNETTVMTEALQLLREIMYEPKTVDNSFDRNIFDREKQTLRQVIETVIDDKMKYANLRLIDEMCSDERYSLHVHGYIDDIDTMTAEELYQYYMAILVEDDIDLYVMGDFNKDAMKEKISSVITKQVKSTTVNIKDDEVAKRIEPKTVVEQQAIQQAKLHIGYRTNCTFQDNDYYALQLFNGLLGGFPSSKLFLNVREKHSLAYYVASRIESHKGILLVFSGIDPKDYDQAKEIIDQQMIELKEGNFTEAELNETKEQINNQILETLDHPQGIIELLYQQVLANKQLSPEELMSQIKRATKADVVQVAQKIELDTTYLLTSEEGEANE